MGIPRNSLGESRQAWRRRPEEAAPKPSRCRCSWPQAAKASPAALPAGPGGPCLVPGSLSRASWISSELFSPQNEKETADPSTFPYFIAPSQGPIFYFIFFLALFPGLLCAHQNHQQPRQKASAVTACPVRVPPASEDAGVQQLCREMKKMQTDLF